MEQDFVDKIYDRIDFKETPLVKGDYESCKFTSCDLSNTDLSEIKFIDCIFISCNLSVAQLSKTVFRDIQFVNCKMLGFFFTTVVNSGFPSVLTIAISIILRFIKQK